MLDLSSTDFNFAIESVDPSQLEILSSSLFDEWEAYVEQSLTLPDYSLFLQIEEGSINGWGKIKSAAKTVVIGLTAYGGLWSGVDIVSKQLKAASNFLAERAQSKFSCPGSQATVRKKGGAPATLQRLFARVQNGELTPEEATAQAQAILGDDASEVPGFLETLSNAFRTCPRNPQQSPLPFDEFLEPKSLEKLSDNKQPKPSKSRAPNLPPPLHYRVEVWRESKRKRKQTKVTIL